MVGMTAALSVAPGLAGAELGEYRVGYISQDGMRHQVSPRFSQTSVGEDIGLWLPSSDSGSNEMATFG